MLIQKNSTFIMIGDSVTDCGRRRPEGEDISIGNGWGDGYVNLVRGYLGAVYPEYNIRVLIKEIQENSQETYCQGGKRMY